MITLGGSHFCSNSSSFQVRWNLTIEVAARKKENGWTGKGENLTGNTSRIIFIYYERLTFFALDVLVFAYHFYKFEILFQQGYNWWFLEIDDQEERAKNFFLKLHSQGEHWNSITSVQQTSSINASTNRIGKRTSIYISFLPRSWLLGLCITLSIHMQFIYSLVLQYWSNKKTKIGLVWTKKHKVSLAKKLHDRDMI